MDTTFSLEAQAAVLDNRKEMLRTLHLAYQHVLDENAAEIDRGCGLTEWTPKRLTPSDERDLGRRLALYWNVGRDILPKPEPRATAHDGSMEGFLRWCAEMRKAEGEL